MTTFEQWARDVDDLCVKHLCCTWADLAGDREPLERSFTSGETPMQFVQWWAERYGLTWVDRTPQPLGVTERVGRVPSSS